MSNWREQLSEESETEALMALFERYYHVPVLVVLVGFLFWNRIRNWSNFVVDGTVYYSGNDPWYHLRMTQYTVENFPSTAPFDPWTYFPIGTGQGQFGTLFDQIIALVALIVGLGSPSESLVRHVFLLAPPFFALLVVIPAYFIGKRLGGRIGGLVGVGILAFAPDRFLQVTLAGHVQHHVFEVLFMSLSVLGVMIAVSVAEREKPVYELVVAKEFDAIRGTVVWSLLAGVALGLYMWTWPSGMWMFGIFGLFFVIYMSIEHLRSRSPEHSAFVGIISMSTAGIMQLSTTVTLDPTAGATTRSLLQPGLAFLVVIGLLFLAWLSREVDARNQPTYVYPGAVAGAMIVSAGLMALLLPDLFGYLTNQIDRVFGFVTSPGATAGTIGEAQPMEFDQIRETYQLAIFTAGLGGAVLLLRQVLSDEPNGEELLIVIWSVLMIIATLTQLRFGYYLGIAVGALNAALVGYVVQLVGTPSADFEIETYQILTVAVIVLVMFGPLLGLPIISADDTAMDVADGASYPGDVVAWDDSLQYLNEHTPEQGQFGHPDNEPMELYGTYDRTDDFEYPPGTYGVMSWWDYGHWITVQGERIPNANPFQQGASEAAEFLLAQDEDEAMDALSNVDEHDDAQTRFVMIDWRMVETEGGVGGKFFAPPMFHDEYEQNDFYKRLVQSQEVGYQPLAMIQNQPYYDSMMVRLYHYHGSAHEPEPMVVEWIGEERQFEDGTAFVETQPEEGSVQVFNSLQEAREYVEENPSAQIGGIGAQPEERVEALEHFRLVHMSEASALPQTMEDRQLQQHGVNMNLGTVAQRNIQFTGLGQALQQRLAEADPDASQEELQQQTTTRALNMMFPNTPAFTKTFERVPGATIEGAGPPNELIQVDVTLDPENGQEFTYSRDVISDDDGNFELVVPYSTTGYDEWGVEEGYAEPNVKAVTEYAFTTPPGQTEDGELMRWEATANVTEAQVIGEDPEPVTVELEERVFDQDLEVEEDNGADDNGGEDDTSNGDGTDTEEDTQDSIVNVAIGATPTSG